MITLQRKELRLSTSRFVATSAAALLAIVSFSGTAKANINLVQNGGFDTTTLTTSGEILTTNVSDWSSPIPTSCGGCYNFLYFPGFVTTQLENAAGSNSTDPNGAADPSDTSQPTPNGSTVQHQVWLYGPSNGPTFPVSPGGGNFLALDADPSFRAAVSQTIVGLTVGATYNLSFDWGGAQYTTKTGATTERFEVTLGSNTQDTAFVSNSSKSFTGWQSASMQFTATDTTEVLSFLADGSPGGAPPVAVLDDVSLTQTPEPAYYLTLVIGLGILALAARRRSKITNPAA